MDELKCKKCGTTMTLMNWLLNHGVCQKCRLRVGARQGDLVKDYGFPDIKKKELKLGKDNT